MDRTKLKIGYDAKRACCNSTGLGNYSRYVVQTMAGAYPELQYLLYTPSEKCLGGTQSLLEYRNVEFRLPHGESLYKGALWRSYGISRLLRPDGVQLYHGLSNELPLNIALARIPTVVTIHDLIFRRIKEDYKAIDRLLYDFKYSTSAHQATRIIAISECTRRDIVNDWQIDPQKIDVIYQGCDQAFYRRVTKEECTALRQRLGLPERYIACVGTVQGRKNQLLAIKALRALPSDVVLAIAGGRDKRYGAQLDRYIAAHHLGERVRWLGSVPFSDLPTLYAGAQFSSYTSRYEGFGIPLVESLAAGTPVIAATGSCLEEAAGKGAFYVDPDDDEAYATAACRLLDDSWLRDKMAAAGAAHIRRFNADDFALRTLDCYLRAASGE